MTFRTTIVKTLAKLFGYALFDANSRNNRMSLSQ